MSETKAKKLVKIPFPVAPFNYLMDMTGYGVSIKSDKPKQMTDEIIKFCVSHKKRAPKVFKFEDIVNVVEYGKSENKKFILVDMSYYKGDEFVTRYMWFEDVKK